MQLISNKQVSFFRLCCLMPFLPLPATRSYLACLVQNSDYVPSYQVPSKDKTQRLTCPAVLHRMWPWERSSMTSDLERG